MSGLVVLSAWRHVPLIEQRLLDDVQAAVAPIVSAPVTLSMNGHQVTITGPVADATERDALLTAMAGVPGVRTVLDRLTESPPLPDEPPDELPDRPSSPRPLAEAEPLTTDSPVPDDTLAEYSGEPPEDAAMLDDVAVEALADAVPETPVDEPAPDETLAKAPPEAPIDTPASDEALAEAAEAPPEAPIDTPASDEALAEAPPETPVDEPAPDEALADAAPETPIDESAPDEALAELPPEALLDTPPSDQALAEAPPEPPVDEAASDEALAEAPPEAPIATPPSDQALADLPPEPPADAPGPAEVLAEAPSASPAGVSTEEEAPAADVPLPSLSLTLVDEALTLKGRLGAEQDLNELVRPALTAFDPSYVTNHIDTTVVTAPADWLEPVADLLPQLAQLSDPSLDIVERQLTIGGTAASRDSHDRLINLAIDSFVDYTVVERVEVDRNVSAPDPLAGDPAIVTASLDARSPGASGDAPVEKAVLTEQDPSSPLARSLAALDSERVSFESGSDVLTPASSKRIDELARLFIDHPDIIVEIEGHTDSTGPAELNLSLSQQRASTVKRALIERGVEADRLIAYGYGEGVPLADNSTAEGRARNRRIEFRF